MAAPRPLVVASNRGPLSFSRDEHDRVVTRRAGGGMAATLHRVTQGRPTTWVAVALSDDDRAAWHGGDVTRATADTQLELHLVDVDESRFRAAYDVVANATLWYLLHDLDDRPRRPRFDRRWHEAWDEFTAYNRQVADAVSSLAPADAAVLVQDYHLALVPALVGAARGDVAISFFSHTPFFGPDTARVLPDHAAAELFGSMAASAACGFHTSRWAGAYESASRAVGVAPATTYVAPLGPDPTDLAKVAASPRCAAAGDELRARVGDRVVVARTDRLELSKNLLRGFLAFDDLLAEHPELRGEVVFVARSYPSREGLADYLAYRNEVEHLVEAINDRWATEGWRPIELFIDDDFAASVALLQRADVLLINPIRDGLNLVAKEGPLLSARDAVLVLSTEAGASSELADHGALNINPFDVRATSDALHAAIMMPAEERRLRAEDLRSAAAARSPEDWLDDQLDALG